MREAQWQWGREGSVTLTSPFLSFSFFWGVLVLKGMFLIYFSMEWLCNMIHVLKGFEAHISHFPAPPPPSISIHRKGLLASLFQYLNNVVLFKLLRLISHIIILIIIIYRMSLYPSLEDLKVDKVLKVRKTLKLFSFTFCYF